MHMHELPAIRCTNNNLLETIHGELDLIAHPYDIKKGDS